MLSLPLPFKKHLRSGSFCSQHTHLHCLVQPGPLGALLLALGGVQLAKSRGRERCITQLGLRVGWLLSHGITRTWGNHVSSCTLVVLGRWVPQGLTSPACCAAPGGFQPWDCVGPFSSADAVWQVGTPQNAGRGTWQLVPPPEPGV